MAPVRVGAIGAGWWATTNHFPQLAARDDVRLVGVCRPGRAELETVQRKFGFEHATDDYRELLEHELDAVVVATPHHLHAEHALAALRAGCHVLCEKPMTLRPDDAWRLVVEARARDRHLVVPLGWNYAPFLHKARAMLTEGAVGRIEFAECHMASPMLGLLIGGGVTPTRWTPETFAPEPGTWNDPRHGGGYAYGQLPHSFGLLFWLTGSRAESATAVMSRAGTPVDMYWAGTATLSGDVPLALSGAAALPDDDKFQIDIKIFGSHGVLLVDVERERLELRRRDGDHVSVPVAPGEGAYRCEQVPGYFIDLIRGREAENPSSGEIGAKSVELIEALFRSAAAGGTPVSIAHAEPEEL